MGGFLSRLLGKKSTSASDMNQRAAETASLIMKEFVLADASLPLDQNATASLTESQGLALENQRLLYGAAIVLMAVVEESRRNPAMEILRLEVERLMFPMSPDEGMPWLDQVKRAMMNVLDLLQPSENPPKPMTWARSWLAEAGIDETNPVTCSLVAVHWMDYYVAVRAALQDIGELWKKGDN